MNTELTTEINAALIAEQKTLENYSHEVQLAMEWALKKYTTAELNALLARAEVIAADRFDMLEIPEQDQQQTYVELIATEFGHELRTKYKGRQKNAKWPVAGAIVGGVADRRYSPGAMLSLSEAAEYIGYTDSGLRKLVRRGEIVSFQLKKHAPIKFKREWLDQFIARGTTPKVAEVKERKTKPKPGADGSDFGFDQPLI